MTALLIIVLLMAAAAIAWTTACVMDGMAGRRAKHAYLATLGTAGFAAWWTAYRYNFFANENTHVYGWPVPWLIFQRDDAQSPWLDYVGPAVLFGLPMNFILFAFLPCLVFLGMAYYRNHSEQVRPD